MPSSHHDHSLLLNFIDSDLPFSDWLRLLQEIFIPESIVIAATKVSLLLCNSRYNYSCKSTLDFPKWRKTSPNNLSNHLESHYKQSRSTCRPSRHRHSEMSLPLLPVSKKLSITSCVSKGTRKGQGCYYCTRIRLSKRVWKISMQYFSL